MPPAAPITRGSTPSRGDTPVRVGISRLVGRQHVALLLEASGLGSRAACERMVRAGRVTLNGRPVAEPQTRADPGYDRLAVDGRAITLANYCRYVAVHKPYQVLSAFSSREGQATLADHVPIPGVYAAGRLDYDSEGLLLLSNDGWFLHRITHPRYDHAKTYLVQVEGQPDEAALEQLRHGVLVKGERTRPAEVQWYADGEEPIVPPRSVPIRYRKSVPTTWLRMVLREGRKRQIRHMTAAVGYPTLRLIRTAIGPITLGDLAPGGWRELSDQELSALAELLRAPRPVAGQRYPR